MIGTSGSIPAPDGGPPNKLVEPLFGRSAWEWEAMGRYHCHAFLTEQPDLTGVIRKWAPLWLMCCDSGWAAELMDPNRCSRGARGDTLLRDEPPNPDASERTPPPERFKHVYTDSCSFLKPKQSHRSSRGGVFHRASLT